MILDVLRDQIKYLMKNHVPVIPQKLHAIQHCIKRLST